MRENIANTKNNEKADPPSTRRWAHVVHWTARLALVGYVALLLQRARTQHEFSADAPAMQLADLMRIRDWVGEAAVLSVKAGVCFGLFGFLVAVALAGPERPRRRFVHLGRFALVMLPGLGLLVLLSLTETGHMPSVWSAVVPLGAYLLGLWVGRATARGPRALGQLLPSMAGLVLIAVASLTAVAVLAMEGTPLAIEPPKITSDGKRRVATALSKPTDLSDGTRRIRLTQGDVNLMFAMAAAQVLPDAKGRMELHNGWFSGQFAFNIRRETQSPRYLNLTVSGEVAVSDGQLDIRLQQCRMGKLPVPWLLLNALARQAEVVAADDPDLKKLLAAVGSVRVEPRAVELVIVSRGIVDNVLPSLLARLGRNPSDVFKTRDYYRHLVTVAAGMPKEERFERLTAAAFDLARRKSQTKDPVIENRAAIMALAVLLGHRTVEHFVGPVTDTELRIEGYRHARGTKLRGRQDWCQHFYVSAALATISNQSLSDGAGLLKEEIDAGEGGSGFSFSDLAADKAGTRLALAATHDETSARRLQQLLGSGFAIGDVFPEVADLPEDIPDAELQADYGGVGGEKYEAMTAEIERRLDKCAALE